MLLKIFEIAMISHLTLIIDPQLTNAQHGSRPKRSVTTNLMNLSIVVHEVSGRGNQVEIFYGDFENEFDRMCHRLSIVKFFKFKIGVQTAKWLCCS